MISREEANDLIAIPKIPKDGLPLFYDQTKIRQVYELISVENNNQRFKLDYQESRKVSLKLSCHHRNYGNIGLIRIDFQGSRHQNPQSLTESVPNYLYSAVGMEIPPRQAHIHIYVEGFELRWAMPIENYLKIDPNLRLKLKVTEINNEEDKTRAIKDFAKLINLEAFFSFSGELSLS